MEKTEEKAGQEEGNSQHNEPEQIKGLQMMQPDCPAVLICTGCRRGILW